MIGPDIGHAARHPGGWDRLTFIALGFPARGRGFEKFAKLLIMYGKDRLHAKFIGVRNRTKINGAHTLDHIFSTAWPLIGLHQHTTSQFGFRITQLVFLGVDGFHGSHSVFAWSG